jgi:hypothetical protein
VVDPTETFTFHSLNHRNTEGLDNFPKVLPPLILHVIFFVLGLVEYRVPKVLLDKGSPHFFIPLLEKKRSRKPGITEWCVGLEEDKQGEGRVEGGEERKSKELQWVSED